METPLLRGFSKNRKKRNWSRSQGRGKCQKDPRGWIYCASEGPPSEILRAELGGGRCLASEVGVASGCRGLARGQRKHKLNEDYM